MSRFVVYGAGAIGGVIGFRLFASGNDVTLIARGAHYDALARQGLCLQTPESSTVLPIPVVSDPGALSFEADDVVVLAMKSQDTAAALDALRSAGPGPEVCVVLAQNGVDNERMALRRFGEVYGVCVMMPAAHLEPGVVQASSVPVPGILDVGRVPSGAGSAAAGQPGPDRAAEIAGVFAAAGFSARALDDIMRWKYAKLIMNLGNAVEALCGPEARGSEISRLARVEGMAVLDSAGIDHVGDAEYAIRRGNLITPQPIGDAPRPGDSSWQSLARGTGSIEADYLNGEIVLLGRLGGVPTPVNALLQRQANATAAEKRPPGTRRAEELLALVAS